MVAEAVFRGPPTIRRLGQHTCVAALAPKRNMSCLSWQHIMFFKSTHHHFSCFISLGDFCPYFHQTAETLPSAPQRHLIWRRSWAASPKTSPTRFGPIDFMGEARFFSGRNLGLAKGFHMPRSRERSWSKHFFSYHGFKRSEKRVWGKNLLEASCRGQKSFSIQRFENFESSDRSHHKYP